MTKKQKIMIIGGAVILIAAVCVIIVLLFSRNQDEHNRSDCSPLGESRQENTVKTSFTEEGSISVGTVVQSFEMDLSEFTGSQSFDFSWDTGGMGGFPQMGNTGGAGGMSSQNSFSSQSSSSDSRQLIVEELYVEVGQEVKAGDPVLKVTADTLAKIRSGLEDDVVEAKAEYDQLVTSQKQTEAEASAALTENQLYGQYADTEYNLTVAELQDSVDAAQTQLDTANGDLTATQEELTAAQESLASLNGVLENAVYIVDYSDRTADPYGWLSAVNSMEDTQTLIEGLESDIESLEKSISTLESDIENYTLNLSLAKKELETGTVQADSTRQTRAIKNENAQEIYDVKTALAEYECTSAKEGYEEALARLEELDTYLADQMLYAKKDGVITEVSVAAGDSLSYNTQLISLNSYDDITITLTLDESEIDLAYIGAEAIVTVPAFPGEQFIAKVTEHEDAQIDSDTNTTTYEIIVTIQENTSRLYEGMSAEVTFGGDSHEAQ